MLKSRLQEAEKAVGEDNNSDCVNGSCFVVQSVPERSTRSKGTKKSSGGIDELPDPESEELVAWRLRSQDLEQELDDLKRDYQQMETDWSNRLVEEQGNRALPIVMVATCVALTVGAGSVYAVNHYHHKDRLKMCERQLEFENRIASLDRAYTETLADLAATEKALESANAEVVRLQQPLQKGDQNSAWWNSLKFW
ncbi:hypothetical protein Pmar_PMAR006815 [Perkinsus marinus ATCC 50983]|uniref:Uncharacterized protein n=1 Tax=Perkinsus marinus (strain ATCC 50983 / TXsc) TaxID=423536 RepID=C5K6K2_PERM5|nr:hypothetical protein Pmar_PMAR006815 [Perkinsus marinus ATCC 50983]EER19922.1 hypothetical protein Pmar_PMAR006815 [Perkinsus marinus ATCC 50983]|eukprot:XP_002788126.1 hypothetical protein Pmar_PMAR006815 [Perkinsus marinus ATCC 50983]